MELHAGGSEETSGLKERARSSELAPLRGKAGEFGVTMIEEYGKLLGRERMERIGV